MYFIFVCGLFLPYCPALSHFVASSTFWSVDLFPSVSLLLSFSLVGVSFLRQFHCLFPFGRLAFRFIWWEFFSCCVYRRFLISHHSWMFPPLVFSFLPEVLPFLLTLVYFHSPFGQFAIFCLPLIARCRSLCVPSV